MKKSIMISCLLGLAGMPISAEAQDFSAAATPYGQEQNSFSEPYDTPDRDENGTRIIINGRVIDADAGPTSRNGLASGSQSGVSGIGTTLSGSTLNSVAIGNNVEISNVSNSFININQRNTGTQTSHLNGRR